MTGLLLGLGRLRDLSLLLGTCPEFEVEEDASGISMRSETELPEPPAAPPAPGDDDADGTASSIEFLASTTCMATPKTCSSLRVRRTSSARSFALRVLVVVGSGGADDVDVVVGMAIGWNVEADTTRGGAL